MKRSTPNLISGALLIAAFLMYLWQDQLLAVISATIAFVTLGATLIWRRYSA
jgi:hypothetical protein